MAKKLEWSEDKIQKLIDEYKKGKSVPELARDHKTTTVTIYGYFRDRNVQLIERPRKYINRDMGSPDFILKLRELMSTDKPRVSIADELGIPVSTLYHYCDKFNIPVRVLNAGAKAKRPFLNTFKTKGYYYLPEPPSNETTKLPFTTLAFVEGDGLYVQISRDMDKPDWRVVQPKNHKKGWFS